MIWLLVWRALLGGDGDSMITKNSTWPICALRESDFYDVRLPYSFFADLAEALPITQQSIADDLLFSVMARETICRAVNHPHHLMGSAHSFAILHLLITRPAENVRLRHGKRVAYTAEMHKVVLALIESYGVTCASGKCCGAVREIVKERAFA